MKDKKIPRKIMFILALVFVIFDIWMFDSLGFEFIQFLFAFNRWYWFALLIILLLLFIFIQKRNKQKILPIKLTKALGLFVFSVLFICNLRAISLYVFIVFLVLLMGVD